jgi:hypothetical protein
VEWNCVHHKEESPTTPCAGKLAVMTNFLPRHVYFMCDYVLSVNFELKSPLKGKEKLEIKK